MPFAAPPAKEEISTTPSPTNAAAKAGFGKLADWWAGLFGTTGKPAEAFAAMKLLDPKAIYNLKPTFAFNTNALTITLLGNDGAALGVDNPGFVGQRNATLGDGSFSLRKIEANLSLVVSAGSTLGHTANVLHPVYIYAIDNAGAQELAVTSTNQGEVAIVSTTAEGGVGGADSATAIYSTTARANVPARLAAVAWFKQAVAGNWANLPTRVHLTPLGLSVPGEIDIMRGAIRGLDASINAVDPTNDIDTAPGAILDDQGIDFMVLPSTLTKRLDAPWLAGNNQGGLDGTESVAGTPDNDTWYYRWIIKRSDTGVVDIIYSESDAAPILPANYDRKRLWGLVRRGTATNLKFYQDEGWFRWQAGIVVLSGGSATTDTAVTLTAAVPPIAKSFSASARALLIGNANLEPSNATVVSVFAGVDFATLAQLSEGTGSSPDTAWSGGGSHEIPNTGTFNYRNVENTTTARSSDITVHGFKLTR